MQENLCERKNKLPSMQLWKHGMCLDKQGVSPHENKKAEPNSSTFMLVVETTDSPYSDRWRGERNRKNKRFARSRAV